MDPATFARLLVARHGQFVSFLRRRLPGATFASAEDVVQAAWVKAAGQAGALRDEASGVAWFYRVLLNAAVDEGRRAAREERVLKRVAAGLEDAAPPAAGAICPCLPGVLETLRPTQAELLRRVDLEGASVPLAAREAGITPNLAGVRLHRARAALRHKLRRVCGACAGAGCLDCGCPPQRPAGSRRDAGAQEQRQAPHGV